MLKSIIHTGGWSEYNGLVDFGYKKHFTVYYRYQCPKNYKYLYFSNYLDQL